MSLAGLRKQFNKANQLMNEKMGSAEGTKLDSDYLQCEKQIDIMSKLFEELINRTQEYLQPNPTARALFATVNTLNKMQGKSKTNPSTLAESCLGLCMIKYGTDLAEKSIYGECLVKAGNSFKCMGELKCNMEEEVKNGFIDGLRGIQSTELKEILHHRKKLEGRRLDFDCKKRKSENTGNGGKMIEDEVKVAEEKFQESKRLAEKTMVDFLSLDLDHISALSEFVESQKKYYLEAAGIMETLMTYLVEKKDEAARNVKQEYIPKPIQFTNSMDSRNSGSTRNGFSANISPENVVGGLANKPCCRGLYKFEAENESELAFEENDVIYLITRVDENWYEGTLNGKTGYFPVDYVEIIHPLPNG